MLMLHVFLGLENSEHCTSTIIAGLTAASGEPRTLLHVSSSHRAVWALLQACKALHASI